MSSVHPGVVDIGEWLIKGSLMRPSVSQMQDICKWYSKNVNQDTPVSFVFHASHNAGNVLIHESRLQLAGGPLAALTNTNFKEGKEKTVSLCEEDDPATFRVIRSFLYGAEIDVSETDLAGLVKVATCSHRWGLITLVHLVSRYIFLEDMIQGPSDVIMTKRIVELDEGEKVFETYFWKSVGMFFEGLSPAFCGDPDRDEDDVSFSMLATSIQKYPEMFEDVWTLAISKGNIEALFENIIYYASRKTKKSLLYVIAATIEPVLKEDSMLQKILRSTVQKVENLTSLLQTKKFQALASSRMLNFTLVELSYSNNLRKQAHDALNGMVCSSFWELPLVNDTFGVRKVFFTQSMESDVDLLHYTTRGGRMLFPRCERPSTSSEKTPDRLEAHAVVKWKLDSSSLTVSIEVTNVDLFPNPFVIKVFLRTLKCNCESRCDLYEQLCARLGVRTEESDSRGISGDCVFKAERLKHSIAQDEDSSDLCVVTLHVMVGHYPKRRHRCQK